MALAQERWEETLREVGTLFIALAPLDASLSSSGASRTAFVLIFILLGITLILLAIRLERRRLRHG